MKKIIILMIFYAQFLNLAVAESVDELVSAMSQRLADMSLLNESVIKGGLRIRLCQYCHGKDGNSVRKDVPNLAEQNPVYLLTQFEFFRTDKRSNKVMNELAKGLSEEERINIALYYASQEVKVEPDKLNDNAVAYKRGSTIYSNVCINCHGKNGHGERTLPRIAGQKYDFLTKTLSAYKENNAVRPDSAMLAIAAAMSEDDIRAISLFVASMQ
ncbi:MAG: c-type cytochrome [Gammaproteobacteria bacterium]|nr:c-type cytochrome [Gammaproteobacteria bacterium]